MVKKEVTEARVLEIQSYAKHLPYRITAQEWKHLLLTKNDSFFWNGIKVKLKAKNLGVGVYEVYNSEEKQKLD